mmetsp:Transcript_32606/g.49135  ORF Transcript_32606/g.49135 Transcript_32606/m.49135 type:complete len:443 (-) Transcript_32606:1882-3210(-)|eukprot:CAMPEP_0178902702 /NCGR_PEP_ID=MMETSP0786-20121207/4754_1 /TAXON_ID=186022 /ORGANISM="Thalassionema frauenfeldii, Strain CCMP 1798" /LENGTH=442 /DNA_ID=CAMNT_0020574003 /DNA_START=105 /DNA_END=1433 /DNA_ORIENTATION=-
MGNLLGSPVTEKETQTGSSSDGLEYGISSMQGWRIHMEDAHIAETKLYAEQVCDSDEQGDRKISLSGHSIFAVFDGHGGAFAAEYSGWNLCRVLSQQQKFVSYAKFVEERKSKEPTIKDPAELQRYIRSGLNLLEDSLKDAFIDIDREIFRANQGSLEPGANVPYNSSGETDNIAMNDSDDESETVKIPRPNEDEDAGTTAVVVVITPEWIVCANAGDSRAVFSKQGHKAVPLSYDHKPDDDEEECRIRAGGGYVAGGRVEGDLAVSRGFGDFRFKDPGAVLGGAKVFNEQVKDEKQKKGESTFLKVDDQKVSPYPDVIVHNRSPEDEFIIVACDGIWDVQTNYECVKTVADIFSEGESDLGLVSEELLDMCLSMGSKDNMTSIIIKFPAQDIGEGGGVMARRQKREAVAIAAGGMTATVVDSDMGKAREEIMIEDTEAELN